ncbi:glycoside hydrolase family 71 /Carbohydrate-binding module family 24 [Cryphonectria parasitica EP155]|uniref:Glycoside hydrolase family 71 /Carbohydrate-binding module family 24 n=1 Tax=Cryphonectria parasitica (strain ATCC 38755 / EP155) TaxID=660469 RepID=A0A9P4Y6T7_CRYP1|nr:glycoside hydrolase family 71 /Carbohydrate-binding module family 24 [Cryphonectria parasitica EP155]KAF3767546.1 glycoside hydrolase family 71 /Carbohydrate-binding module family 24 [Cryphonectria parasitica EP155]
MVGFHSFSSTCLLAASLVSAAPSLLLDAGSSPPLLDRRQNTTTSSDKLVFCHFMVGIISDRTSAADWDSDMQIAKDLGIDAFALNIGTDDFTDTQLGYAYESAANNGMSVFISFDFNWWDPSTDAAEIGDMIAKYGAETAQLMVDGKIFASSFAGDGLDVAAVRSAVGADIFFAPNFHPSETTDPSASIDGALNWMGWNNNGDNKAPVAGGTNITVVDGDDTYKSWLSTMPYIAPISPWFSTHYGPEVTYSKNFVFPSDLLWFTRWTEILTLSPHYVEMITWNDYGESHYIGPLSSMHYDDGASKWVNDMPHDGFRTLAKPFISAYKAGAAAVDSYITEDQIVYWYRPTPSTVDCDSTDNTMGAADNSSGNYFNGKPNGYEDLEDAVFVVTLLTADGTLSVTSGDTTQTFDAKAGANAFRMPMGVGQQTFSLTRDSKTVLSGTSLKDIQDSCICGIYNFNTYVGTLPAEDSDPLGADGLASFLTGLSVTTCLATPSLGTPTAVAASTTGAGSSVASSSASSTASSTPDCNAGTVADGVSLNLLGLCTFACAAGFCPTDTCVCTSTGTVVTYEAGVATTGCALSGEDAIYDTLCAYTCQLGYCPDTACSTDCSS